MAMALSYNDVVRLDSQETLLQVSRLDSCPTRYLTRSLCSRVRYQAEHSKRNSIFARAHGLSLYKTRWFITISNKYAILLSHQNQVFMLFKKHLTYLCLVKGYSNAKTLLAFAIK